MPLNKTFDSVFKRAFTNLDSCGLTTTNRANHKPKLKKD